MATLHRLASGILDLALPPACAGCGREGAAALRTTACRRSMPAAGLPAGTPIGLPADIPAPLLQLEWCAPYAGPVRAALHELKYAGEQRLAVPLGIAVARRWARVGVGAELVVPVPGPCRPRAPARLRPGGADRGGGRGTRSVCRSRARSNATARRSPSSSWAATSGPPTSPARSGCGGPSRAAGIAGRWVLLVDDVVTTGRHPGGLWRGPGRGRCRPPSPPSPSPANAEGAARRSGRVYSTRTVRDPTASIGSAHLGHGRRPKGDA